MKIQVTLNNGDKKIIYGNKFCRTGADAIKIINLKVGYFKWKSFEILKLY